MLALKTNRKRISSNFLNIFFVYLTGGDTVTPYTSTVILIALNLGVKGPQGTTEWMPLLATCVP